MTSRGLTLSRSDLIARGYQYVNGVWCPPATYDPPTATGTTFAGERYGRAPNGRAYKSKTEARYADYLDIQKRTGLIWDWQYENITLLIGHDTRYTPDFIVERMDRKLEAHETKAKNYWRNGKSKFRTTAMLYPWLVFKGITWEQGRWAIVESHNV